VNVQNNIFNLKKFREICAPFMSCSQAEFEDLVAIPTDIVELTHTITGINEGQASRDLNDVFQPGSLLESIDDFLSSYQQQLGSICDFMSTLEDTQPSVCDSFIQGSTTGCLLLQAELAGDVSHPEQTSSCIEPFSAITLTSQTTHRLPEMTDRPFKENLVTGEIKHVSPFRKRSRKSSLPAKVREERRREQNRESQRRYRDRQILILARSSFPGTSFERF
jgi:hypothetical protein